MKKIVLIISVFILFSACSKLEDLNKNVKDFAVVSRRFIIQWSHPAIN